MTTNIAIVSPKSLIENGIIETGRYVICTKDISQGSEVLNDESLQIAIDTAYRSSHCFSCGSEESAKQLCPSCKNVCFCSACSHDRHVASGECALITCFETTYECEIPVQCILAFRIVHSRLGEDNSSTANSIPCDLCAISPFALVGSHTDNDDYRLELAVMMSGVIQECLKRYPEWGDSFDEITLRTILQIIKQNAFRFGSGLALFPLCSFVNHSCAPNTVMTMEKNQNACPIGRRAPYSASLRCLRDLVAGEEISISYRPLSLLPCCSRRDLMLASHGFTCQCLACSSEVCDGDLLGQALPSGAGGFFAELSLEPLVELLDMAEEWINEGIATATTKPTREEDGAREISVEESVTVTAAESSRSHGEQHKEEDEEEESPALESLQLLQQAEFGFRNMGLLPHHHLQFRRVALLAEASLLAGCHADVVQFTEQWMGLLESTGEHTPTPGGITLLQLCDTHLRCRMLVIRAESLVELFQTKDSVYSTRKFANRVISGLQQAIDHAKTIYGDDYALVAILQRKREGVEKEVIMLMQQAV
jgi:hypothetical protein